MTSETYVLVTEDYAPTQPRLGLKLKRVGACCSFSGKIASFASGSLETNSETNSVTSSSRHQ
jgi:hypothetical protein